MKVPGKSIVKPKPMIGFSHRRAVCIPVDTPSRTIGNALIEKASNVKKTPFGHFYLLDKTAVLYLSIGASATAIGLERLIASGIKEILILGFCGSLNPNFSSLAVVSIQKARSEEGTSRHYVTRQRVFHPNGQMRREIENSLSDRNLSFLRGTLVSTDAPFRETEIWLRDKQKKGIDVVDMETSAVFALGEYHNIPTAALMIVSDELAGHEWKNRFKSAKLSTQVKRYFFPFL